MLAAPDPFSGAERLVDAYGLGGLVPNTVLLGDSEDPARRGRYCRMITHFHRSVRNVVIVRAPGGAAYGARRRVDVWWGGLHGNGGLMIMLAYLLQTSSAWDRPEVQVHMVVDGEAAARQAEANLVRIARRARLEMRPRVVAGRGRPFAEVLRASSGDADLVMLGMAGPGDGEAAGSDYVRYFEGLQALASGLPATLFVLAAGEIGFGEMLR